MKLDKLGTIGDPTRIHDGSDRPRPGHGMAMIRRWSEHSGASGRAHELELEIVAWSDRESVAKRYTENIFHTDTSGKGFPTRRLVCLGMAAGLFNARDVEQWKRNGGEPDIDYGALVDRPMMIELVEEPDRNDASKIYLRIGQIGLAMYHIKDPRVTNWPKNQALWNRHAADVGEWITELNGSPGGASKSGPEAKDNPFAGKV